MVAAFAGQDPGLHSELAGGARQHAVEPAPYIDRLPPREQDEAGLHLLERMQLDAHGGHHAEVPAAAPQRPEQLGFAGGIDLHPPPVLEDDVSADQVVQGKAEPAGQRAVAAGQDLPGHADAPGHPDDGGQAVPGRGVGDLGRGGTAGDGGDPCPRVDGDPPHPGQVDHQPARPPGPVSPVMAATEDRKRQLVLTRGADRGLHVTGRPGAHD